ncbi:MAG: ATP-dependent helicase RecG [Eubacteriaceae bacterium]|jgi:ATP-dependent DNA helicase RecG|nr:ATP-dependent helicase RecG [Eubacteriaceae bacterium]
MNDLILLGENKYTEFKSLYTKSLLKTVSAYANYHDGIILVGINDQKEIIGIENLDDTRLQIENAINDVIDPRPYYEIEVKQYEQKNVLLIQIFKGDNTPYLYEKKAYKRLDTASVPVDRRALEELILYGKNMTYEMIKAPVQELTFSVLKSKLKERLSLEDLSNDLLITLELKSKKEYNLAAALLSDHNPIKNANLQLIAYEGSSVSNIKDRQPLLNVSLLKQFDLGIDFFKKHINQSEIIRDAYRELVAEVPLVAYREALANLIVHRDYSRAVDARVEIFNDRIEIMSPGGLPIGISESEYLSGRISVLRNRIVGDIFYRLQIVEKLATGIRRIKEYYQPYPEEPEFYIEENSITVVLPKINQNKERVASDKNNLPAELSENEIRILSLLAENESMTRQQIEEALNLKKTQTNELIKGLKRSRKLIQVGSGRSTAYKLN